MDKPPCNLKSWLYSLYDLPPTSVVEFLTWLPGSYGLNEPISMLDVGCGPGRLLHPLTELGWCVTGLEPDADYWAQATLTGCDVRHGGFEDIDDVAAYDLIAAVNAPYAYLLTIDARMDALRRVYRALKPGGVVFIDVRNVLWMLRHYQEPKPSILTAPDGKTVKRIIQRQFDFNSSTFKHIDHFYIDDVHCSTQTHHNAIITTEELRYTLRETGFRNLRAYNHYVARESQPITGERLMVSAQKPSG